jgi:NAD(P)-dependent dehydrogenase (short-subunit alcohol dehydrogenase family)
VVHSAIAQFGQPDIPINNAGVHPALVAFLEMTELG